MCARPACRARSFNKAADLISEVLNGYYEGMDVSDALSRIYVWLRYSATRQLTWQRNYNTQPRILSAAQERLTNTIANAHGRTTGGLTARPRGSWCTGPVELANHPPVKTYSFVRVRVTNALHSRLRKSGGLDTVAHSGLPALQQATRRSGCG